MNKEAFLFSNNNFTNPYYYAISLKNDANQYLLIKV